jgi:hypothetical protein
MKIPFYQTIRATRQQRRHLAEWLAEWDLDFRLRADEGGANGPESRDLLSAYGNTTNHTATRYDSAAPLVEPGDIHLLPPVSDQAPLYVLVVEKSRENVWWIVPFSRFATPAVPGEWLTGLTVPPLRVVCLWNVREATSEQLAWPGKVKHITAKRLAEIQAVFHGIHHGRPIPDNLARRQGPPLVHPGDPRRDYLEEERGRLLGCFPGKSGLKDRSRLRESTDGLEWSATPPAWRLAAEGRRRYGVTGPDDPAAPSS